MDLQKIKALALDVTGWANCDKAWLDTSEDVAAAVVGAISEDGETYPVAFVDCDQYDAPADSMKLAKFYAAANPAAVLGLVERVIALESLAHKLGRGVISWRERQWPGSDQSHVVYREYPLLKEIDASTN